MENSGDHAIWTAPRLVARLAALGGVAPAPTCYVLWRVTTGGDGTPAAAYTLPGEAATRDEPGFEQWLKDRDLAAMGRLTVSVLAIRETLGPDGLIRDGVLERRRGGADGPYYGPEARIEFSGGAHLVRRYEATRDGRLVERAPEPRPGPESAPEGAPDDRGESFAGEDEAVLAHLGAGTTILDRRAPSLFEEMVGLSGIVHARRGDGREIPCGVGWHGTAAFVLTADFPRHRLPLLPPPAMEAALAETIATHDLIRHETRLDNRGLCAIARRRGRQTLVAIRWDGASAWVEPYQPGRTAAATEDQRRWMTYAETYEARSVLDSWPQGMRDDDAAGEIAVVTVDPDGEAWRHVIDEDGVETSRHGDNDAAAAVLYRERAAFRAAEPVPPRVAANDPAPPEQPAPADSLLSKVRAYVRVMALLRAITEACAPGPDHGGARNGSPVPAAALDGLQALLEPLALLNARLSAAAVRRLAGDAAVRRLAGDAAVRRPDGDAASGPMFVSRFVGALEELVIRLRDELALIRIILLPAIGGNAPGEAPFGGAVEVRFPAAAYDIEEAVHCLAMRRTTASVMHAEKVLRRGLAVLERVLSLPPLGSLSWAALILAVHEADAGRQDMVVALNRARRAWRGRGLTPADKYTEEEAEAVLEAVASFMRALAARCDKPGEAVAENG